jgi:glycosidase
MGSHDTIRILELAKGDVSKVKLALLFQMTFIGAPTYLLGDEIAMLGGKDPDNVVLSQEMGRRFCSC